MFSSFADSQHKEAMLLSVLGGVDFLSKPFRISYFTSVSEPQNTLCLTWESTSCWMIAQQAASC